MSDATSEPQTPSDLFPLPSETGQLTAQLAAAHKRIDELARAYQASERDREDFKQRLQRERERLLEVDKAEVARSLIEAIDELDLCLGQGAGTPLHKGVQLIREKLLRKLESSGVERLLLVGTAYDPQTAEAADVELCADPEDEGLVVAEVRAGYRLKQRVIRPARVKVARYVPPASA